MRVGTLLRLWLPLAISVELMMLEGPAVQGAMGRLANPQISLAAWGLTMSLSLLIESPIIMLLSTAIALVRGRNSYLALRRFMLGLISGCTMVTAFVAFTPLFDFIAGRLMGQPQQIIEAARPAMRIMLLWTAAIGWRRFYQGILIQQGQTRKVSWGTAIRLGAATSVAVSLAAWGRFPGAVVGAIALMAAVVTEAIATSAFALPVVRRFVLTNAETAGSPNAPRNDTPTNSLLTQADIWRFHLPLAATTLIMLAAQPVTSAALARLPHKEATLAAWPVVYLILLIMRAGGFALQEITISQATKPEARHALQSAAILVGTATTLFAALVAFSPLLDTYLGQVIHAPRELWPYIRHGVALGLLLPLLTALGSWARGLLVAAKATNLVYRGMGLNVTTHGILLVIGVALRWPGMTVAALAFTCAALIEFGFLLRSAQRLPLPPANTAPNSFGVEATEWDEIALVESLATSGESAGESLSEPIGATARPLQSEA